MTTDHDEIKRWASHRRARPVRSLSTGEVRLDLPADEPADVERPIDWDEWFDAFDRRRLAFLYYARQADNGVPTHNELVTRAA